MVDPDISTYFPVMVDPDLSTYSCVKLDPNLSSYFSVMVELEQQIESMCSGDYKWNQCRHLEACRERSYCNDDFCTSLFMIITA